MECRYVDRKKMMIVPTIARTFTSKICAFMMQNEINCKARMKLPKKSVAKLT